MQGFTTRSIVWHACKTMTHIKTTFLNVRRLLLFLGSDMDQFTFLQLIMTPTLNDDALRGAPSSMRADAHLVIVCCPDVDALRGAPSSFRADAHLVIDTMVDHLT